MKQNFPLLKIVPLSRVVLHEEVEHRRVRKLALRIERDGFVKNPIIAAELNGRKLYVILDGANRQGALRRLGIEDIPVQIIDYKSPEVELHSWNHLLKGIQQDELLKKLSQIKGLKLKNSSLSEAEEEISRGVTAGYLNFNNTVILSLKGEGGIPHHMLIKNVFDAYRKDAEIKRFYSEPGNRLFSNLSEGSIAVVFRKFSKGEILYLAENGIKLPAGVTRHIIPGRVVQLNLKLSLLKSEDSLEERNEALQNYIEDLLKEGRIRFYNEPVFCFNE
ncbi:MAG: ParB N-terminal domain-containing protein [Fidelibacterota bacterium]